MTAPEMTEEEMLELLNPMYHGMVQRWLDRGDGVAVYKNADLGHPDLGHMQFVSFGSEKAQLEVDEPPQRMPDIGGAINWRYQLEGKVKR